MLSVSFRRALFVASAVVIALYAAILLSTDQGQLRAELDAVVFLSVGVPVIGVLTDIWLRTTFDDRWLLENVGLRGMIMVGVGWTFSVLGWLVSQEIIPFRPAGPGINEIGRLIQPFVYCFGSLGGLRVYFAFIGRADRENWRGLTIGLVAAGLAFGAVAGTIALWHAA